MQRLIFAPDGALWAATDRGVVVWNLDTDEYLRYDVNDGLSANYVRDLAFGPDGTLWAATGAGVSHFDGITWTAYGESDGVAAGPTYTIAVAPDGVVWAGGEHGLSHFDGRAWRVYTAADGLAADFIWYLDVAPDGIVWISTAGAGVSRFDPARQTWTTYMASHGLPELPNARKLTIAPDGAPWLHVGYENVYRFDGETWEQTFATGGQWVCDMAFDAGGTPWLASCGGLHAAGAGLVHQVGESWEYVTMADGLVSNTIETVARGPNESLAVGTGIGISVRQNGQWRTLRAGPVFHSLAALAVAGDGAVWVGYGDQSLRGMNSGLSRFDGENWDYFAPEDDFPMNGNVLSLAADADGGLWAGGYHNLAHFDGETWQSAPSLDESEIPAISSIAPAPDGSLWIAGSGMGLAHLVDGKWTTHDHLASSVAVAPDGVLWAIGWEGLQDTCYLARFDGETWDTYYTGNQFEGCVGRIATTSDGSLWGTLDAGLLQYDGEHWITHTTAGGIDLATVNVLHSCPDGSLWAGAQHTLIHYDGETWRNYTAPLEENHTIKAIACPAGGNLWLGTTDGLFRFLPTFD